MTEPDHIAAYLLQDSQFGQCTPLLELEEVHSLLVLLLQLVLVWLVQVWLVLEWEVFV